MNDVNVNVNVNLLKRPIFLASLPVAQFASLDRKHLFAELARLDRLLDQYPVLIASQPDIAMVNSLRYCEEHCLERYAQLRRMV
jgi:hypothetical protein